MPKVVVTAQVQDAVKWQKGLSGAAICLRLRHPNSGTIRKGLARPAGLEPATLGFEGRAAVSQRALQSVSYGSVSISR